jgi:hypothetical protein
MKKPDIEPVAPKRQPHHTDRSGCVVCGQYQPELTESAGEARWHKECGAARPDVIRKVKARA